MKKLLSILAAFAMVAIPASAKGKVYHSPAPLPEAAQNTLSKNFSHAKINRVKVDYKLFGGEDYEVILSDGTEVEFDGKGNWTEVDCGQKAVPASLVIKPIQDYVKSNYKGQKIIKIDNDSKDYEIELSNGVELKFDKAGRFLRRN